MEVFRKSLLFMLGRFSVVFGIMYEKLMLNIFWISFWRFKRFRNSFRGIDFIVVFYNFWGKKVDLFFKDGIRNYLFRVGENLVLSRDMSYVWLKS